MTAMKILEKGTPSGYKVAIVGSGPAGLQAATSLAVLGYNTNPLSKKRKKWYNKGMKTPLEITQENAREAREKMKEKKLYRS